jgi:TIR domain
MKQQESTIEVFCCYAHEDELLLNELKTHLSPLQRQQLANVWHDRDISAGAEWEQEIEKHLNKASIILLLISPDFISSEYCYGTEMNRALELHKRREARVIPILLRPVDGWEKIPLGDVQLGQLQALPKEAKPITRWTNRDEAWKDVAEGISRVINELTTTQLNRQKQIALEKVEKLVPEVDVSLYQDTFGKPTFINRKPFFMNPNDELRKFVEYVFVDEYFYLDAIADDEGKVLYFALTIRDKTFNPIFKNQVFQVQLGVSKYSDIPGRPHSAQGCFGANWFAYYETKYFGRPGAYQDFGFGFNTAGYYDTANGVRAYRGLLSTTHNCHGTLSEQEMESVRELIAVEVFNTYAVSAPGVQITDYAYIILGVNYDQVRILNP